MPDARPDQRPDRPSERRHAIRTGVVWSAIRGALDAMPLEDGRAIVVDIGGGTGGFAVPLAALGHQVLVVDPSPDALAALARRADEQGLADQVVGVQGDLEDLPHVEGVGAADLVLCHGVLEVVSDPVEALRPLAGSLRPGGRLSLLAAQRHAGVVGRAMAGHFADALELLEGRDQSGRQGRRFTSDELVALLDGAGLVCDTVHAIRVFADLVPGSLLELEPGAGQALVELEKAVADRPEYLPLAAQVHLLATR